MEEQFVTYEIALKLKELGFNEECIAIYISSVLKPVIQKPISGELNYKFKSVRNSVLINAENCSAPLWQQVIDWVREKYNWLVVIDVANSNEYYVAIREFNEDGTIISKIPYKIYSTYNQAREQAILKALELIK